MSADNRRSVDSRPLLLDLFCGAGGAAVGYHRAGFDVIGVDAYPQPHYPFPFALANALTYPLDNVDAIHASPPCQRFSALRSIYHYRQPLLPMFDDATGRPDCLTPMLARLAAVDVPWVVENVPIAPMPGVLYCGSSFGLRVRRHRRFASNVTLLPPLCDHDRQEKPVPLVIGHGGGRMSTGNALLRGAEAAAALGIDWTDDQGGLVEAIPPAYTEHIGRQLLAALA